MPAWVKIGLWIAGIWLVCYAFGTSPAAILSAFTHALTVMHNTSTAHK